MFPLSDTVVWSIAKRFSGRPLQCHTASALLDLCPHLQQSSFALLLLSNTACCLPDRQQGVNHGESPCRCFMIMNPSLWLHVSTIELFNRFTPCFTFIFHVVLLKSTMWPTCGPGSGTDLPHAVTVCGYAVMQTVHDRVLRGRCQVAQLLISHVWRQEVTAHRTSWTC